MGHGITAMERNNHNIYPKKDMFNQPGMDMEIQRPGLIIPHHHNQDDRRRKEQRNSWRFADHF